ncbi:MAG: hypothetical protein ACFHVJ_05020 [Aestuariibacter sp.]
MSSNKTLRAGWIAAALGFVPLTSSAGPDINTSDTFALKTSIQEVIGVREIEAGKYQSGIRKSNAALSKVSVNILRAPLLNNLCVAHIAINDLNSAKQRCDDAVQASDNAIARNNRAVLHCLSGNTKACAEDFTAALEQNNKSRLIEKNIRIMQQQYMVASN